MAPQEDALIRTAAIVLTGGTAARLDGADKAAVEVDGATLLEHVLAATTGCHQTVVVGPRVPTSRPVTFAREDPPGGGPGAALLAGLDALAAQPELVAVLAVDMPRVTPETLRRLHAHARGTPGRIRPDGALLVDGAGRRQLLCGIYRVEALVAARPVLTEDERGIPVRRLLAGLDLVDVPARADEARDIDTWADLRALREGSTGDG